MVTAFVAAAAVAFIIMPYIKQMLEVPGALKKNYLGEWISTGMGIGLLLPVLAGSIVLMYIEGADVRLILPVTLGISVMSLAGIVDDLLGDGDTKGLKGHFSCLFGGKLTTGGFKALVGGMTAVMVSVPISARFLEGFLNCIIVMLFTNLINLLDLRPGRAIKTFFLAWGVTFLMPAFREHWYVLYPLAGGLAAYLPYEMGRKGMLGDAGSNGVGAALGIYYCLGTGLVQKALIVTVLVLLHIAAEKFSFTKFINRNRILRYIDGVGNKGSGHA